MAEREGTGHEVLAAARGGDRSAFLQLLRDHDRLLRVVAWQVLGDRDLMDDALQEVAVKAWRGLRGYRGDATVATWLGRLAYNAAVDLARRERRREAAMPLDAVGSPTAAAPAADADRGALVPLWSRTDEAADPADAVGERARLRDAFSLLSAEQRLTVLLVDREGYDYAAVAAVLGVRAGTVASRLSRAHAVLREALSDLRPAAAPAGAESSEVTP